MLNLLPDYDNKLTKNRLWMWWPITIYLGWIIVATVACVAAFLVYIGWNGGALSMNVWTIIMIGIGCIIYVILCWKFHLLSTALVGIWAFTAIAVRHWGVFIDITWSALTAVVFLSATISIVYLNNTKLLTMKKFNSIFKG